MSDHHEGLESGCAEVEEEQMTDQERDSLSPCWMCDELVPHLEPERVWMPHNCGDDICGDYIRMCTECYARHKKSKAMAAKWPKENNNA